MPRLLSSAVSNRADFPAFRFHDRVPVQSAGALFPFSWRQHQYQSGPNHSYREHCHCCEFLWRRGASPAVDAGVTRKHDIDNHYVRSPIETDAWQACAHGNDQVAVLRRVRPSPSTCRRAFAYNPRVVLLSPLAHLPARECHSVETPKTKVEFPDSKATITFL